MSESLSNTPRASISLNDSKRSLASADPANDQSNVFEAVEVRPAAANRKPFCVQKPVAMNVGGSEQNVTVKMFFPPEAEACFEGERPEGAEQPVLDVGEMQKYPVVVHAHGRPRAQLLKQLGTPVYPSIVDFWISRNVVVVAPFRPGHGPTGGPDVEGQAGIERGCCGLTSSWNPEAQTRVASEAIEATADWVSKQPWAGNILLSGQSAGGMAAICAASDGKLPKSVVGVVNYAGGLGATPKIGQPREPEKVGRAFQSFGESQDHVQSLWLYAKNDEAWGAAHPFDWHRAYDVLGKHSNLVQTGDAKGWVSVNDEAVEEQGHRSLARCGRDLWEAPVTAFAEKVGFLPKTPKDGKGAADAHDPGA